MLPEELRLATFENVMAEAMAFGKYTLFASFCDKLGYYGAALLFQKLATNEKEHMEQLMEKLDILYKDDIEAMLKSSLRGEQNDANTMYPKMETLVSELPSTSKETGEMQTLFMRLSMIETHHATLLNEMLYQTNPDQYDEPQPHKEVWVCSHCGMIYDDYDEIPDECPVCKHPKADYVLE